MSSLLGQGATYFDAGVYDSGRRSRSESLFASARTTSRLVLPSVLPHRRRSASGEDMLQKSPLLTLKLSSPSFLDSEINEDLSRNPIYVIRTQGTSTTITRSDPWEGSTKTAEVKWPKDVPVKGKGKDNDGVLVQMKGGRWESGFSLLRPGSLIRYRRRCLSPVRHSYMLSSSAPRKFSIPGYPRTLKWKQVGSSFQVSPMSVLPF
jgi:hypothetical protein